MAKPPGSRPPDDRPARQAESLASVYNRFGVRLYRAAVGMLGSADDAEDAVHDVFVGLLQARPDVQGVDDLTAYLFASLRRGAGRRHRLRQKERQMVGTICEQKQAVVSCVTDDRGGEIEDAMRSLPPKQREVVALKIYGGLTFSETAAALEVSVNTAASRYRYALEKLRRALQEDAT